MSFTSDTLRLLMLFVKHIFPLGHQNTEWLLSSHAFFVFQGAVGLRGYLCAQERCARLEQHQDENRSMPDRVRLLLPDCLFRPALVLLEFAPMRFHHEALTLPTENGHKVKTQTVVRSAQD
ncbi:MAG: hypothetical protein SNJ59_09110 [Aggregatilineales bacterium]